MPRILAILGVFVIIIVGLAGLVLLIVPLGVSEVTQLQVQAPTLAAAAQERLNNLQPVRVFGVDIDLKGITKQIKFDAQGEVTGGSIYMYEVKNGKLALLGPEPSASPS